MSLDQLIACSAGMSTTGAFMAAYSDPAALRLRLQRELRRLRSDRGFTQKEVADAMDWSPSKVIRIEAGTVGISTNDLKQLLSHYGITDSSVIDQLVAIGKDSRSEPWAQFRDALSPESRRYWGYETSAAVIREFQISLVPGLLQTEEYTRAMLPKAFPGQYTAEALERTVEARKIRQALFDRDVPPETFFIIDESALRREIGGRKVMLRQLDRIEELGTRPRINIRILRFDIGAHAGLFGPFSILEFADGDPVLLLENRTSIITRDNPDEISEYVDQFQVMEREFATAPADLAEVLDEIRRELRPSEPI